MSDSYTPPKESTEPFDGDRGWDGMERSPGEGGLFALVVGLLLVIVLAVLLGGVAGLGFVFVLFTFVSLAVLVLISVGQ